MKHKNVSRRNFMKNLGTGVLGTGVALTTLPKTVSAGEEKSDQKDLHGGRQLLSLKVNGHAHRLLIEPNRTLAEVIREDLELTGTKIVCNQGECGACTVLMDGVAVYSCHMLAMDAQGKEVTTIEGLMNGEELGPVQKAFLEKDGFQCGFCTPGQVMAAEALLNKKPKPTRDDIIQGMSGNLCRCAAYPKIIESVMLAAEKKTQ